MQSNVHIYSRVHQHRQYLTQVPLGAFEWAGRLVGSEEGKSSNGGKKLFSQPRHLGITHQRIEADDDSATQDLW